MAVIQGQDDSTRAVEWGYLDSLAGVYYYDDIPYTGPVIKQLETVSYTHLTLPTT